MRSALKCGCRHVLTIYAKTDGVWLAPTWLAKVPARAEFKVGVRVTFNDRDNGSITGTVSRVNQKTVSVAPDNMVGRWRVSAALLDRLVDI